MEEQVTFSRKIKDEISSMKHDKEEERAILSGFIRYSGTLSLLPELSLRFVTSCASAARMAFQALKDIYNVQPKITYTKELRLNKSTLYHVEVKERPLEILEDLEIMGDDLSPLISTEKFLNEKDFHGFLMGCFLASGQVSDPDKGHYYCEMVFNDEKEARVVLKQIQTYKDENTMNFKIIKRRNKWVLYLKQSDQISVFLGFIGSVVMMMEFESKRLDRDYYNNENRLDICAQANYEKAMKKGQQDLDDIASLEKLYGEAYFTPKTSLLADLRKKNPDASYSELAQLAANKGLNLSKSGVVHVFRKFHQDALSIKKNKEE